MKCFSSDMAFWDRFQCQMDTNVAAKIDTGVSAIKIYANVNFVHPYNGFSWFFVVAGAQEMAAWTTFVGLKMHVT